MKIKLLDYKDREYWVDIPDDTEQIKIKQLTGDMMLLEPIHCDPNGPTRTVDFFDGEYIIPKSKFEEFNNLKKCYDIEKMEL